MSILCQADSNALRKFFCASWRRLASVNRSLSSLQRASESPLHAEHRPSHSHNWQLFVAACVQRRPLLAPQLAPQEAKFADYLRRLELRNSLLSDHEVRDAKDRLPSDSKAEDADESDILQLAADFEEECNKEFSDFKTAPTENAPEVDSDVHNVRRFPRASLYLVTRQQLGSQQHCLFPQKAVSPGQTLRQTCESALSDNSLPGSVSVLGNAPIGFYQYKYPGQLQHSCQSIGAKVFFFKAFILSNDWFSSHTSDNCMWLSRSELKSMLHARYYSSVDKFILSDS